MENQKHWYRLAEDGSKVYKRELNIPIPQICLKILKDLREKGHLALIVGGAVRDAILGYPSKDIDIEVYGIDYENLSKVLSSYGKVNLVGKAFGVVKLIDNSGQDYDFSIPRRDSKVENNTSQLGEEGGNRGRGIKTEFDTNIKPKEAASRRDFTFNSLSFNPLTNELHDYFGGVEDMENGIMRATSEQFAEDPLRVLRGFQFVSRFGFQVDPKTAEMARTLKDEPLVKERISEEWMKFFTKSKYPSKGLQYLIDTGWIENYPELNALVNIPQDPEYHPEGTVDFHLGHCLDSAILVCDREGITGDDRAVIMASVLGHDLGKSTTTKEEIKNGIQRITSKGHAELSGPLTRSFLERIGIKNKIIDKAVPLTEAHMMHIDYNKDSKKANVRQIAEKIYPATIKELMMVIESDHSGRPPLPGGLPDNAKSVADDAMEENAYEGLTPPLIQGRDIMHFIKEKGPIIGEILKEVRKRQLEGSIRTKEKAVEYAMNLAMRKENPINGQDVLDVTGGSGGPHIKDILSAGWYGFLNGEKVDKNWIQRNYGKGEPQGFNETNIDTEDEDEMNDIKAFRYSDKTLKKISHKYPNDKGRSPSQVILEEMQKAKARGRILNKNEIRKVLNDEDMLDSIVSYFEEAPEHAIETYMESTDEELSGETGEFMDNDKIVQSSSETKFGDVPNSIQTKNKLPDYKALQGVWPNSADIAMEYVQKYEPGILDNIVYIGITDDPSVAGVYEPDLTDEIQGSDTGQRQGIAFRLSPQKIESEVQSISQNVENKEDIEKLRQIVIAEIIIHEADHANGEDGEQGPISKEKNFLSRILNDLNQKRKNNGIEPLPVDIK